MASLAASSWWTQALHTLLSLTLHPCRLQGQYFTPPTTASSDAGDSPSHKSDSGRAQPPAAPQPPAALQPPTAPARQPPAATAGQPPTAMSKPPAALPTAYNSSTSSSTPFSPLTGDSSCRCTTWSTPLRPRAGRSRRNSAASTQAVWRPPRRNSSACWTPASSADPEASGAAPYTWSLRRAEPGGHVVTFGGSTSSPPPIATRCQTWRFAQPAWTNVGSSAS
jgi:hypothetical protein